MDITFQFIPIDQVKESKLNPRKRYDEVKMKELTESIRGKGILTPLLVRTQDGFYEIAAGTRRYRAALTAGLKEVPVIIRKLNDVEFLEIITIENLQREDVHPMEEASGFRDLMKRGGYDVATIAAKVGKSESYVYQRLKLADLIPEAQRAFLEEKITAGHAILIARLQSQDQTTTLNECLEGSDWDNEMMSVRELADHIERQIHLDLNSASFSKKDPDLIPEAGSCTTCPKRTGFQPTLFPDIKKKDTCTDPKCFHAKVDAFIHRWVETKSQDTDVPPLKLSGDFDYRAKKIPDDKPIPANLYQEITDKKKRSCGSAREGIITEGQNKGKILMICTDLNCKIHHPQYSSPEGDRWRAKQKAANEKTKREQTVRVKIIDEIIKAIPGELSKEDLAFIAEQLFDELWTEYQKKILMRHDLKPLKIQYGVDMKTPINIYIGNCGMTALGRLLMEMALIRNIEVRHWMDKKKKDSLLVMAEHYKVDPKKIEAEMIKAKAEKKGKTGKKLFDPDAAVKAARRLHKDLEEKAKISKKQKTKKTKMQTSAKKEKSHEHGSGVKKKS